MNDRDFSDNMRRIWESNCLDEAYDKLKLQYDEILGIATTQANMIEIIKGRLRKHLENHDMISTAEVLAWFDEWEDE